MLGTRWNIVGIPRGLSYFMLNNLPVQHIEIEELFRWAVGLRLSSFRPAKKRRHQHVTPHPHRLHPRRPSPELHRQVVGQVPAGRIPRHKNPPKVHSLQPLVLPRHRLLPQPPHRPPGVFHSRRQPVLRRQAVVRRHQQDPERRRQPEAAVVGVGPRSVTKTESPTTEEEEDGKTGGASWRGARLVEAELEFVLLVVKAVLPDGSPVVLNFHRELESHKLKI
ncbi:LIM and cysteine-rich domains protein 1 [Striga asiatica]|uniref:LIM and cysteine-rich domains protein 1 n=1 Tax=Striga asiatica TaxID=4170 RepID=A0A5A7P382_STRAF|nr:LIM and cysteine-rich domains protein 1 [Striga asiatica]